MKYTKSAVIGALREVLVKHEEELVQTQQKIDTPESERLLAELRTERARLSEVEERIEKEPDLISQSSTLYSLLRRSEGYARAVDEYQRHVLYGRESKETLRYRSERERQANVVESLRRTISLLSASTDTEVNTTELERLDVYKHLRKYL